MLAVIEVISFAILCLATLTLKLTVVIYHFDGYYHHGLFRFIFSSTIVNNNERTFDSKKHFRKIIKTKTL